MLAFTAGISCSGAQATEDMNPSLMLCSFRIWSLKLARISASEDMTMPQGFALGGAQAHAVHFHAGFIPTAGAARGGVYSGFDLFGPDGVGQVSPQYLVGVFCPLF